MTAETCLSVLDWNGLWILPIPDTRLPINARGHVSGHADTAYSMYLTNCTVGLDRLNGRPGGDLPPGRPSDLLVMHRVAVAVVPPSFC